MPLSDLKPADYNPRTISKEAAASLGASLARFGLVDPLIVNKRTGYTIVGGHQRYAVMQQQGIKEAQVVVVDLSEPEERALNVTLNNQHIAGDWNQDMLVTLLDQIRNEAVVNFEALSLDKLLEELNLPLKEGKTDPDAVPDKPAKPVTRPGDLYTLGDHRLLCGDATKEADVLRVLAGEKIAMIFTDPPWNVAIGLDSNPRHRQRKGLDNDNMGSDFPIFLAAWTRASIPHLTGDIYCVMGCQEWPGIDTALRGAGLHWSGVIMWLKDIFVLGRSNYHRRFEPIWYGWPLKKKSSFRGGRAQDDVWEFPRPKVSEEHPTMKPVALVEKAIQNSSKPKEIVMDMFGGAGSTMMAAERTDRHARLIELDPGYCDVIVKRWEEFTGKKAQRVKA